MGAFPTMLSHAFTINVSKCVLHFLNKDFIIQYHIKPFCYRDFDGKDGEKDKGSVVTTKLVVRRRGALRGF